MRVTVSGKSLPLFSEWMRNDAHPWRRTDAAAVPEPRH